MKGDVFIQQLNYYNMCCATASQTVCCMDSQMGLMCFLIAEETGFYLEANNMLIEECPNWDLVIPNCVCRPLETALGDGHVLAKRVTTFCLQILSHYQGAPGHSICCYVTRRCDQGL